MLFPRIRLPRIRRRTVLRGAGGAALALPLLEAMLPTRRARADATSCPKRAIFMFSGNGFPMSRWKCQVNPSDDRDFQLSPILAPLANHKGDCLFVEGAGMESCYAPAAKGTAHPSGTAAMFTGHYATAGSYDVGGNPENQGIDYAGAPSVDRVIADHIGGATKFDAYHFAVLNTFPAINTRPFYAAPFTPQSGIPDPWVILDDLFGDFGADPMDQSEKNSEHSSILDAVLADFKALRCKVGQADRERLDMHASHIESIEEKLGFGPGDNPACELLDIGAPIGTQANNNIPAIGDLQMDLLTMAITCDLTRVAGLQWVSPVNGNVFSWLGHSESHHTISHKTDATSINQLTDIGAWYAERFALLIDRLKAVPEAEGNLFDNTVMLWGSECGDPWVHDRHDVAWTIAGDCQGFLDTGRYVKTPGIVPHNRLLMSVAAAMGVDDNVGDPAFCADGALTQLHA